VTGGSAPPAQPAEICDQSDNDCDGAADEDFNLFVDEGNCGTCGTVCESNQSVNSCVSGVCTPTCSFGWVNGDGNPNNGCETLLNTNPVCSSYEDIGSVSGDSGSATITTNGVGEKWLRLTITEDSTADVYLSATVILTAPDGVDYNLYAYCFNCGSGAVASSTLGANSADTIRLRANDDAPIFGEDDTHVVYIEIRFHSAPSAASGTWTLTIQGNTAVNSETCNP
jgi:hypothetical protein